MFTEGYLEQSWTSTSTTHPFVKKLTTEKKSFVNNRIIFSEIQNYAMEWHRQ